MRHSTSSRRPCTNAAAGNSVRTRTKSEREEVTAEFGLSAGSVISVSEETPTKSRSMVDWSLAASTGALLVRGGPVIDRGEAEEAVTELRELTSEAEGTMTWSFFSK